MSGNRQKHLTHIFTVLRHTKEPSILMWPENGSWSLPCIRADKLIWWRDIETINTVIQSELGDHLRALRCLTNLDDTTSKHISHKIYTLENRNPSIQPIKGKWVNHETLANLSLAWPAHRPLIQKYLSDMKSDAFPSLPAWSQPGWFEPVCEWFEEQLSTLGYTLISPIKWFYSCPTASILRAHTTSGYIYLKACSTLPLYANEPRLTSYLATQFPNYIPTPLAINHEKNWMLLLDLNYPVRNATAEEKTKILDLFAHLQIKSITHTDKLLQMGCPDLRMDNLNVWVDQLREDEQVDQLRKILPRAQEMWHQLLEYKVPLTLVHGDLHLGNVAFCNGKYLFFDWGRGCLSHPFFDLVIFSNEAGWSPEYPQRYLTSWTQYETMENLLKAWELAKPLSDLQEAIIYHHAMQEYGSQPEEMTGALSSTLRKWTP